MESTSKRTAQVVDMSNYRIDDELMNLTEFLERNSLWVPQNFIQNIKHGDIIEIYSFPEHKQIYANKEFSRLSSYTAEEMSTQPFHKLFWRDDGDQRQLVERAAHVASQEKLAVPWGLEPHELVEALHPQKRTFEMRMGWISPCFDAKTGERKAWASTLQVQFIYEWPEAL